VGLSNAFFAEFREHHRLKAKLEKSRLDFDAKLNKLHKSKKENCPGWRKKRDSLKSKKYEIKPLSSHQQRSLLTKYEKTIN
jgi:hypothetical protein